MPNGKTMIIYLIFVMRKKTFEWKVKVKLDLSNYASKVHLRKNPDLPKHTSVVASRFSQKVG